MKQGWIIPNAWRLAAGVTGGWGVVKFVEDQLKPEDRVRLLEMLDKARGFAFRYPLPALAIVIGAFLFYRTSRGGGGPFTILAAEIDVEFLDAAGEQVRVVRNQLLRAQKPDVTISLTTLEAHHGRIEVDKSNWFANVLNEPTPELFVWSRGKAIETLHKFKNPIPFPAYAPLVPDWLLGIFIRSARGIPANMPRAFRRLLLHRQQIFTYLNEFNQEHVYQQFSAGKAHHRRVSVTFRLPNSIPATEIEFSAFRIFGTGAEHVQHTRDMNTCRIETHLAPEEILRLNWHRGCSVCHTRLPRVALSHCPSHTQAS